METQRILQATSTKIATAMTTTTATATDYATVTSITNTT
jgi:hypothetical protein